MSNRGTGFTLPVDTELIDHATVVAGHGPPLARRSADGRYRHSAVLSPPGTADRPDRYGPDRPVPSGRFRVRRQNPLHDAPGPSAVDFQVTGRLPSCPAGTRDVAGQSVFPRSIFGGRPSNGVDRTTVERVLTFA